MTQNILWLELTPLSANRHRTCRRRTPQKHPIRPYAPSDRVSASVVLLRSARASSSLRGSGSSLSPCPSPYPKLPMLLSIGTAVPQPQPLVISGEKALKCRQLSL